MNTSRILLGGLVAGLVINLSETLLNTVVVGKEMEAAMAALNRPGPISPGQISMFIVWGFCIGILAVWLYAAIRTRFGPGPGTAIKAALVVWFLGYFLASWPPIIFEMFPLRLMLLSIAWGGVEVILGTLLGAKLYKEEAATSAGIAAARA